MTKDKLISRISGLLDDCLAKPGMTSTKLCEALRTSQMSLWRWRKKKTLPEAGTIKRICEVGEVDFKTFVNHDARPTVDRCLDIKSLVTNYKTYLNEHPLKLTYCLQLCTAYVAEKFRSSGILTKTTCQDLPPTFGIANSTMLINFKDRELFDLYVNVYGDVENVYVKCLRQANVEDEVLYCESLTEDSVCRLIDFIQQTP